MQIFITGATSGIGQAIASGLAADGHCMHLHARDSQRLNDFAGTITEQGGAVHCYTADLAVSADIERMVNKLSMNTSHLDVLINNAFGKLEAPLNEATPSDIAHFFHVSVAGTAIVVQASIPFLSRSRRSHVINIVADWGFPMHNIMTGPSLYISGKYAVHGLGAAWQTELAQFGIRTTNLCPGVVAADTPYNTSDEEFLSKHSDKAIHPRTLVDAIRFVINSPHAHVRSIVLSPGSPDYNGL